MMATQGQETRDKGPGTTSRARPPSPVPCLKTWPGVIEAYRWALPVTRRTPIVTLCEGNTPLIRSASLSRHLGRDVDVYLKYEGMNPTGSFKDRGMTLAMSKAVERGSRCVVCASTGNTSASASAYAARAGLRSFVLLPRGAIALGKLAQALMHGATVLAIDGNFDACLALVKEIAATHPVTLVNSLNPFRLEGQKTGAFEICDALGAAPDVHCIPVGNAGNITAYWRGYREYRAHGRITALPRMLGFQAAGAAPIVRGRPVAAPRTIATAIRIGNPAGWQGAVEARDQSGGLIEAVTDAQILHAYRWLAQRDGVFAEPASAASVAGLLQLQRRGYFTRLPRRRRDGRLVVVCVLTGHGLKDPDRAIAMVKPPRVVQPRLRAVVGALGLA